MRNRIAGWIYSFGRQHLAVLLASMLAVGLCVMRIYLSRTLTFGFLIWNLFLAWVPYLSSLWADRWGRADGRPRWHLMAPIGICIAFFPNAPYLVTDLQHLGPKPGIPIWYDVGMLAIFAWTGLFLAMFSLRTLQVLIRKWWGSLAGWIFVLGLLGLSSVGLYLGRFLRWNSWDLLLHPQEVIYDTIRCFSHPLSSPGPFGVVLMFTATSLACYLMLLAFPPSEQR